MVSARQRRRTLRPELGRLEGRAAAASIPLAVLEQVFLERINDHRATLAGADSRPFALLPALEEFAAKASTAGLPPLDQPGPVRPLRCDPR